MVMGFLDFWLGGAESSSSYTNNYEDHIVPVPQHTGRPLTHSDCFGWLNQRVVIILQRFPDPQVGTVKYIGTDDRGKLCAGIEFDYNVGGMKKGKVQGMKLFKCKPGHGLLVPVEYVRLQTDHGDMGRRHHSNSDLHYQSFPIGRVQSVPNISRQQQMPSAQSQSATPFEEYTPIALPELRIGDNVVWLGGETPQTGIVKWIGRAGRGNNLPVKAWIEMDDYLGYGRNEMDMGTRFGCASGRGRLFPVEELLLFEHFMPVENIDTPVPSIIDTAVAAPEPNVDAELPTYNECLTNNFPRTNVNSDLIDFSEDERMLKVTEAGNTLADDEFRKIIRPEEILNASASKEVLPVPPSYSMDSDPPHSLEASAPPAETPSPSSTSTEKKDGDFSCGFIGFEGVATDVNGNMPKTSACKTIGPTTTLNNAEVSARLSQKLNLVNPDAEDFLPPFIVPPIDIVDFFRMEGPRGIQGKRNSCYIDVVLFSLFAFTDTFDSYFLAKSTLFSKVPDSALTKTAKKVLAAEIVNPLRQNYYCSASGVHALRELMIPFSDKLDGAFLDIEELMLILFDKLFQLKEFIVYSNGVQDYLYQVNLGDHALPSVMTLKECLSLSMDDYNVKLKQVPSPAFIIEIPRHHSGIVQSTTIVPNLTLNLIDLLSPTSDSPRRHTVMNLVAVICIHEFHFVTFVKCGKGALSHWVLFDSNPSEERPKVEIVTNMGEYLESLEHQALVDPRKVSENKHKLPPHVQQLLSDIYVCIYCPTNMV